MCGVKMPNIVETMSIEVKYTKPDYEPLPKRGQSICSLPYGTTIIRHGHKESRYS